VTWHTVSRNKGFLLQLDPNELFECYVDANYCGNWNPLTAEDPSTAKSCSGYLITYMGCPIVWASHLQTVFALSTAEAEYIVLSTALRDVIPMMDLLSELKDNGFDVQTSPLCIANCLRTIQGCWNLREWPSIDPAHETSMQHGIIFAPT
jgi:hypothetical protein